MRREWFQKNIDLEWLSRCVEVFLRDNSFKAKKKETVNGYTLSATSEGSLSMTEELTVEILKSTNGFAIVFLPSGGAHSSVLLGLLSAFIGGGNLLLRGVRSRERLEELERDFWVYVEHAIKRSAVSSETS